ncbi:PQQ-binding-like beta-propeller repeat protein [Haloechinothrix halophila]|uniref:hypothetical protein n=1 Tax=Haloechinothrix halophila TaxID=1069073 RepID=UPI0004053269|nr:hypothetical protein [Haloechinothrix halophila]
MTRTLITRVVALCATVAIAAAGVPAASAHTWVPIPPGPADLFVPRFEGAPAVANPVASRPIPEHPYLADNGSNSMHNDAYASDAYAHSGPLGEDPRINSATYGIEECATMAFDRAGRIVALCGGLEGSRLMLLDPESLAVLGAHPLPPRQLNPEKSPLEDICAGAYFYLDHRDRAVIATTNAQIWVVGQQDGPPGFALERTYDLGEHIPDGDCLVAQLPDWSGHIWFVTQGGGVGTVDPESGDVRSIRLSGEQIVNSFAVDETGGVFIVSTHALYRFDRGPDGEPRVTWREEYDRGSRHKPGQLSQGSGTTPTLVGDDLVVITDNADPRMHVIAYHRTAKDRPRRRVCAVPVFEEGTSATENSIVAAGRSVIVENNYGYTSPLSTMFGGSTAPGIARVEFSRSGCATRWTSDEIAPTNVPKASLANGLLYVYTKPEGVRADPWYFTAIDIHTGRTVWKRLGGTGLLWNNHYASIYLGPDGAAYLATLAGVMRVTDSDSS